jgi:hypothetical protein
LVSDIKAGTQTEGIREQGAQENIWAEESSCGSKLERTAYLGASELVLFAKYNYNGQVKEDAMGSACSTNRGAEKCRWYISEKAKRKDTTRETKT